MNTAAMYQSYQRTAIETASPEQLVLMLYDGALRFLNQAKVAIREDKLEETHKMITRSQNILNELLSSLNYEKGGDIARNLGSLYTYMHSRLIDANLRKDAALVQEVQDLLTPIRDAWVVTMKK